MIVRDFYDRDMAELETNNYMERKSSYKNISYIHPTFAQSGTLVVSDKMIINNVFNRPCYVKVLSVYSLRFDNVSIDIPKDKKELSQIAKYIQCHFSAMIVSHHDTFYDSGKIWEPSIGYKVYSYDGYTQSEHELVHKRRVRDFDYGVASLKDMNALQSMLKFVDKKEFPTIVNEDPLNIIIGPKPYPKACELKIIRPLTDFFKDDVDSIEIVDKNKLESINTYSEKNLIGLSLNTYLGKAPVNHYSERATSDLIIKMEQFKNLAGKLLIPMTTMQIDKIEFEYESPSFYDKAGFTFRGLTDPFGGTNPAYSRGVIKEIFDSVMNYVWRIEDLFGRFKMQVSLSDSSHILKVTFLDDDEGLYIDYPANKTITVCMDKEEVLYQYTNHMFKSYTFEQRLLRDVDRLRELIHYHDEDRHVLEASAMYLDNVNNIEMLTKKIKYLKNKNTCTL